MLLNNRYQILETLGRGGFGETYLAEDTNMPSGRKCVIKQLKPIVQQPQIPQWMQERFQREAVILEELGDKSPQIPGLYAYFSEKEQFYLVQEWIEGETLAQKWQREGNLHSQQVKQILVQLLPVLDFIHSRRIVHRDIKPENIIIRDRDYLPVLIDFGAVKEALATTIDHNNSSAWSASIGTPGYMPSEQAAGRPLYSSDLYSLGLTGIFLLTGKSPQELETDTQTGEIIWQNYGEDIEPNLLAVLDKAIRFHPRDRYSTALEMLQALQPNYQGATRATVKVSPAGTYRTRQNFQGTVAYKDSIPRQKSGTKNNWLGKVFFVFLVTGVLGTLFLGVTALLNSFASRRQQPTPQAQVEPNQPQQPKPKSPLEDIIKSTEPEETSIIEEILEATKRKIEEPLEEVEEIPESSELEIEDKKTPPEIIIETKPTPPIAKPKPKPKPEINIPIVTTGTSESQLVSTLGQPTSERNDWRKNSRILVYQDAVPDMVNLSYRSDSTGKIRQTDIALNQSLTLGSMQNTLAQMLGGNAPSPVKEKLRRVYNRQDSFSFFKVGKLEGKVQRDSKDRVTISVWESGYQ